MFQKTLTKLHNNILIFSLILLSVFVRLFLINIPAFKIDMNAWVAWAYRLNEVGFTGFYSPEVWTNYTPGYLYVLSILGFISALFSLTIPSLELLIKIVSILFEIALVIFIYFKASEKISIKNKYILSALILFNPALIFNSTIWGQVDGILTFFLFTSVYYLANISQTKASLHYAFSFLIKPQSIAIAPLFIIDLIKNKFFQKNLTLILPGTVLFFILSLPFFPNDPLFGIFKLIIQMTEDYPATSLFAYNLWGMVGFWISDIEQVGITYRTIGTLLFISSIILTIFLGLKKKADYFLLAALVTLFFYFLPTRVHERYLYPAIPFLLYSAFQFRSKILTVLTVLLSLTYTLNLYYVYVYYNEMFESTGIKVLYHSSLYPFLDSNGKLLSLFSTLIFSMIVWIIIKIIYAKKPHHETNHKT